MDSELNIAASDSTFKATAQDGVFPLFPFLPKELRLQIWEEATPRERLIQLTVAIPHDRDEGEEPPYIRYLEKNHLGNPVSGSGYLLYAKDASIGHELFSVNREARQVALDFYRIHIPCQVEEPGPWQRTLYLNPEHDVLQIRAEAPVKESLVDFLWDLKAYDPKGVGLLKVAWDLMGFCGNDLQYLKRSDLLLIRQRKALVETLSQLQEVWFVYIDANKHGCKKATDRPGNIIPYDGEVTAFESIGPDARGGVETELQQLYMGSVDPRELIWRWKRLLRTWEIQHQPGLVRYRLMVAQKPVYSPDAWRISRLPRLMESLSIRNEERKDDVEVTADADDDGPVPGAGKQQGTRAPEPVTVGFWSFPLDAVGEVGEGKRLCDMDFHPHRVLDMRNYWPELLLAKVA